MLVGLHGSTHRAVDACQDAVCRVDKHTVALAGVDAVVVALHAGAQRRGLQGQLAALLSHLVVEGHVGYQSTLLAARRLGGVALDERRGQGLLEEHQSVDVAGVGVLLLHLRLTVLLIYRVA